MSGLLPELLHHYSQESDIHIKVRTTQQYQLIEMLSSGVVDVALISASDYPKSLHVIYLWNEPVSLAVGMDHPLLRMHDRDLADVVTFPLISLSPDYEIPHYWDQVFAAIQEEGREPRVQITTDNLELAKHMLKRSLYVAFLPHISIRDEVERGELTVIQHPLCEELTCGIYLLHKPGEKKPMVDSFHRVKRQ